MFYILITICYAQTIDFNLNNLTNLDSLQQLDIPLNLSLIDSNNNLLITLTPSNYSIPMLLIICDTQPIEETHSFAQKIQNENQGCVRDYHSYINGQLQQITITKDLISYEVGQLYSIYNYKKNMPFIGIYFEEKKSSFNLEIKQALKDQCIKTCKNNGMCLKGFCECQFSFIGSDCGIPISNLESQSILMPDQFYFYHIKQHNQSAFELHFEEMTEIQYACQHQYLIQNIGIQIITNSISFNQSYLQQCLRKTIEIQEQLPIRLQSYVILKQFSQNKIELQKNISHSQTKMMILVFLILIVIALSSMLYLFYHHKNPKDMKALKVVPLIKLSQALDQLDQTQKDVDCSLCMKEILSSQSVRITYCNHLFHDFCFKTWWNNAKTCPRCKSPLDIESLKKNYKTDILQQSTYSNIQSSRRKNLVTFVDTGSTTRQMATQQKLELQIK